VTDKDRHSTRANSKVSDPSKPELIHTLIDIQVINTEGGHIFVIS